MSTTPSLTQKQFRLPTGLPGRIAGWFMARENRRMNRMASDWLDVGADDSVLEIGFGPGHGIELLAQRTSARLICGIDPSTEMLEQASTRNQQAIDAGRVRLVLGEVEALPFADEQFSRIMAVSNFHVWPSRAQGLDETLRVLKPGGKLVICLRIKLKHPWPWSSPGVSLEQLQRDQKQMEEHGFRSVQIAIRKAHRRNVCLIGER